MIITLNTNTINALDISSCNPRAPYFYDPCGQEHYRLLCYISTLFENVLFTDIGTSAGDSAKSFGFNRKNKVITFDIIDYTSCDHIPNCDYVIGDFKKYMDVISISKSILYDIPHSGTDFIDFCNILKEVKWEGFLILDDFIRDKIKERDWNLLDSSLTKIDITKYGHYSGTEIVNFSENNQFILE
jgi:hypothetical protein